MYKKLSIEDADNTNLPESVRFAAVREWINTPEMKSTTTEEQRVSTLKETGTLLGGTYNEEEQSFTFKDGRKAFSYKFRRDNAKNVVKTQFREKLEAIFGPSTAA